MALTDTQLVLELIDMHEPILILELNLRLLSYGVDPKDAFNIERSLEYQNRIRYDYDTTSYSLSESERRLESVNPGENQMLNILSEEERKELDEQLGDVSLDDYEDIAEADAVNMWIRKRNEIKDDLAVDMKMYEERLNQQLAQPPEDVDNELIETGAELLSQLNCVGTIGTINEEIAININQVAEELVSMCSDAISELE